jgi:hypothetical protein
MSDALNETKKCPACAEEVKAAAVVCRFCGFDFSIGKMPSPPAAAPASQEPQKVRSSVGDGVRLGCGMFIILPILLLILFGLLAGFFAGLGSTH